MIYFVARLLQKSLREVSKIFKNHVKAVKELLDKPYDSTHPVQDLRDRMVRIKNVEEERKLLLNALNQSCPNLTLIEKIIFTVISFFHSLWQPTVAQQVEKLDLPVKFCKLIDKKGPIQLGTTEIMLNGDKIPLNIIISPDRYGGKYHPSGTHLVSIQRADTNEELGYMTISRSWTEDGSYVGGGFWEDVVTEPRGNLRDPFLFIRDIRLYGYQDKNGEYHCQDKLTGDVPVLRILTQLAVEIAERESINAVVINSMYAYPDVYSMAGFYSVEYPYEDDPTRPLYRLDRIRKHVLEERAQNKKLYPNFLNHDHSGFLVHLDKGKFSEVHGTKYFRINKEGKQPAYVEFDLDGTKRTWEEQIAQHPILQPGTGPVLWRFWKRDLAKEARI